MSNEDWFWNCKSSFPACDPRKAIICRWDMGHFKAGFEKCVRIRHFLGGCSIKVAGDRAVTQTKMTINQRAEVEGVLCDVVCTGRFYDF